MEIIQIQKTQVTFTVNVESGGTASWLNEPSIEWNLLTTSGDIVYNGLCYSGDCVTSLCLEDDCYYVEVVNTTSVGTLLYQVMILMDG